MAAQSPFQISSGAAVGKSIIVESSGTGTTITNTLSATGSFIPNLICSNFGPNKLWVRLTTETSTPAVTIADHCMLGNTVQLFSNPASTGVLTIAIMVSVTTSANTLYVTPGQGSV